MGLQGQPPSSGTGKRIIQPFLQRYGPRHSSGRTEGHFLPRYEKSPEQGRAEEMNLNNVELIIKMGDCTLFKKKENRMSKIQPLLYGHVSLFLT